MSYQSKFMEKQIEKFQSADHRAKEQVQEEALLRVGPSKPNPEGKASKKERKSILGQSKKHSKLLKKRKAMKSAPVKENMDNIPPSHETMYPTSEQKRK